MAGQITPEGQVLPPRNITAPAPLLSLRGFHWDTVDKKLARPQLSQDRDSSVSRGESHDDADVAKVQEPFVAATAPLLARAAAVPAAPAAPKAPVPQLPQEPLALSGQLTTQLGHVSGRPKPGPPKFPLEQFQGAYAGNGFNLIFRPRANNDDTVFEKKPNPGNGLPPDNILQLSLTTEQLTFGATLGNIPNRGLFEEPNIFLTGLPYLQTVQDVTNPETGKGDRLDPTDIHFEPGVWLNVPKATFNPRDSVVRMASIPHGTTINAQGLVPTKTNSGLGGAASRPIFDVIDTTPFFTASGKKQVFPNMNAADPATFRIPQNLERFNDKPDSKGVMGTGLITTEIIKNPNLILAKATQTQNITETITFEVSTGFPTAELNGGGTTNISFLAGKQAPLSTTQAPDPAKVLNPENPIAHAAFMKSKFWIETVQYDVFVPKLAEKTTLLLSPEIPAGSTAPTPVFAVTTPPNGNPQRKKITIPGIQIQSSQTVNLNFAPLTWPHVSVATMVPKDPQPFQMT
ncbi:uncharacterized protein HMPREF1541_03553 [Cyphellophora europaea CBS 101466]|uniref:Uncharacterized protein n=1 Tax=Cyphellophora europaea (strain CBS 101466) TaxID=1220924 RepID=W2RYU0_CYPE1|nr:uncharacterized protein HMPREF1541_03553 [Cyphellophora europaea CBS 101466]ETN41617.1 hypothetical protein HMPREF1541_03553 [Cyphellophora europaea CBS 101466]